MKRDKYYLLLKEYTGKLRKYNTLKQNAAFTMDTIKFDYACKQLERLVQIYAKKIKKLVVTVVVHK